VNDIRCLCNHTAADHGLTNDEARGEVRAPCQHCHCDVFEEDPTYEFIGIDWVRPSSLVDDSPGVVLE
jgi:hypothetical protein